jgi:hypothetical protein
VLHGVAPNHLLVKREHREPLTPAVSRSLPPCCRGPARSPWRRSAHGAPTPEAATAFARTCAHRIRIHASHATVRSRSRNTGSIVPPLLRACNARFWRMSGPRRVLRVCPASVAPRVSAGPRDGGGNTQRRCLPGATWETPVAESGRSCSRYFFLPSRSSVISATATTAVMGSPVSISFLRAYDQSARYGRDRTARLEHEPHTTVHQLIWVLLRSGHDD